MPASLTGPSEDPEFFDPAYLKEIGAFLLGGGVFGYPQRTGDEPAERRRRTWRRALIAQLPPRGHGPARRMVQGAPAVHSASTCRTATSKR